ncbi:hypothetical protein LX81_00664 [Palleronia aestuarii]|uniref:Uncharacterized protein n=1 Tax=Palleronia aestuarii TaxID=568105 RepID=A0A2W7NGG4_9RHOB|nr:hypothetical protein LX81_00664 [Palleronia aestuarii]
MSFSHAANSRVTGHYTDGFGLLCDQDDVGTHTGGCVCRFDASVPPTNDGDRFDLLFHVKHLFADTEGCEDVSQYIFYVDSASDTVQDSDNGPELFRAKLVL